MTPAADSAPLVSFADLTEIELVILKRVREVMLGEHRSRSHGAGFDFNGLRDWQAGDRLSSIDWAQSSLTNFSPMIVREFDQPSAATVVAVADRSLSTRCGAAGAPVGVAVARAVATIGLSATFFQDPFGLITFDEGFRELGSIRPRTGRAHVVHCLDAYQHNRGLQPLRLAGDVGSTIGGYLHRTAMIPVISDFLFDDWRDVLQQLSHQNATHDVFIVLVDSSFAFAVPPVSSGWVDVVDVETGRTRTLSRRTLGELADRVKSWQSDVRAAAKDMDLDVVQVGIDATQADLALAEFIAERRLRKVGS
jgi:uncharacterized protein (DUF58 family)